VLQDEIVPSTKKSGVDVIYDTDYGKTAFFVASNDLHKTGVLRPHVAVVESTETFQG